MIHRIHLRGCHPKTTHPPGAKSTTGRAITHNLDSPDDLQTLTPLRAHYLKKTLISLQFSEELRILTTQPSDPSVSTLSYLGAPFTPLPRNVPRQDLPFLRFMFRQFALTFPFLAAAPKDFFPNKLQPFIASVVSRNLSSATNLLESNGEAQANDGQQMLNKAEKHLALLLGAAMKLVENEEVVRLSQADLARIEKAAERRRRKAEAAGGAKRAEVFDVNVIAVRAITDKGRVRSKVHEVSIYANLCHSSTKQIGRNLLLEHGAQGNQMSLSRGDMAILNRLLTR
jgi:hypothetical protein